jgi:hypothetical protein
MYMLMQDPDAVLQSFLVLFPPDPVDPGRSVPLKAGITVPEFVNGNVME